MARQNQARSQMVAGGRARLPWLVTSMPHQHNVRDFSMSRQVFSISFSCFSIYFSQKHCPNTLYDSKEEKTKTKQQKKSPEVFSCRSCVLGMFCLNCMERFQSPKASQIPAWPNNRRVKHHSLAGEDEVQRQCHGNCGKSMQNGQQLNENQLGCKRRKLLLSNPLDYKAEAAQSSCGLSPA